MRSTTALTTAAAALALLLAGVGPGGAQSTDGDTGGTTGQMTTTPDAKSDDAAGTHRPAYLAQRAPAPFLFARIQSCTCLPRDSLQRPATRHARGAAGCRAR